jgi:hypothetical protein
LGSGTGEGSIKSNVFEMAGNKAKKTCVMKMPYLDWRNLQRHFGFLMENGVVKEIEIQYVGRGTSSKLMRQVRDLGHPKKAKVFIPRCLIW